MIKEQLKIFADPQQTAEAFGAYLMKQVEASESFHCALSGGSTPKLLFKYLAENYTDEALWKKLHLYWGDERCVPPEDEESNYKMTNDLLLSKVAIPEVNIHRVRGEDDSAGEAKRYGEELLDAIPVTDGKPVFDLIILGMGDDGHTASIFPHQIELLDSDTVCEVATHPTSGQKRVTLTGEVINAAKEVVFLVTGAGKKERISEIYNQEGDWVTFPAAHIDAGKLFWFVDEAAVSGLDMK